MLDQGTKTIDWDDFRFVLAIVRGGSVSAAAKQLSVDHATVIRRVDRLERHLSAKLFDRRKTGYLLTEAGQRVADSAEAMESTIVANQEAVGGARAPLPGTVRIGAPDGFGSHFLASRLLKFTERYPDLDLQLVATARLLTLSKCDDECATHRHCFQSCRSASKILRSAWRCPRKAGSSAANCSTTASGFTPRPPIST